MQKLLLKISDMHCASCVMRLEGIEDDLDGVAEVNGSYVKQTLEVVYDEARLDVDQILKAVKDLGYSPQLS